MALLGRFPEPFESLRGILGDEAGRAEGILAGAESWLAARAAAQAEEAAAAAAEAGGGEASAEATPAEPASAESEDR